MILFEIVVAAIAGAAVHEYLVRVFKQLTKPKREQADVYCHPFTNGKQRCGNTLAALPIPLMALGARRNERQGIAGLAESLGVFRCWQNVRCGIDQAAGYAIAAKHSFGGIGCVRGLSTGILI